MSFAIIETGGKQYKVSASKILEIEKLNVKDRTVLIFNKRRRKHSRKKNGHRQRHSKIQITKILAKGGKVISEAKIVEKKKPVKEEKKVIKKEAKK